ncbi:MAG: hypothetical protein K8R68_07505 [Bacteroidales bacterium]|nr:hypothetical protein [Bacteroidales bacterium]
MALNRYSQLIEKIFFDNYKKGSKRVEFLRTDIEKAAKQLKITLPKNLGDVIYSFRFRTDLPSKILDLAKIDEEWLIKLAGRGTYCFSLEQKFEIIPNHNLAHSKILDSTPGVISKYSLSDEQALLAILRYNRLVDTFLGITCYSLQNHLRTTVPNLGQVETDEIYIGVDKKGVHYVIPIQAKGGSDKQGKVQIEQDLELCATKFPNLICIPVAAQFMPDGKIALFSFEQDNSEIKITSERHYELVGIDDLTDAELFNYQKRK